MNKKNWKIILVTFTVIFLTSLTIAGFLTWKDLQNENKEESILISRNQPYKSAENLKKPIDPNINNASGTSTPANTQKPKHLILANMLNIDFDDELQENIKKIEYERDANATPESSNLNSEITKFLRQIKISNLSSRISLMPYTTLIKLTLNKNISDITNLKTLEACVKNHEIYINFESENEKIDINLNNPEKKKIEELIDKMYELCRSIDMQSKKKIEKVVNDENIQFLQNIGMPLFTENELQAIEQISNIIDMVDFHKFMLLGTHVLIYDKIIDLFKNTNIFITLKVEEKNILILLLKMKKELLEEIRTKAVSLLINQDHNNAFNFLSGIFDSCITKIEGSVDPKINDFITELMRVYVIYIQIFYSIACNLRKSDIFMNKLRKESEIGVFLDFLQCFDFWNIPISRITNFILANITKYAISVKNLLETTNEDDARENIEIIIRMLLADVLTNIDTFIFIISEFNNLYSKIYIDESNIIDLNKFF